jgi:hypothetical protein
VRHVGTRAVGGLTEDFLGGGVDVVERLAGLALDELAVDEHPHFTHVCLLRPWYR